MEKETELKQYLESIIKKDLTISDFSEHIKKWCTTNFPNLPIIDINGPKDPHTLVTLNCAFYVEMFKNIKIQNLLKPYNFTDPTLTFEKVYKHFLIRKFSLQFTIGLSITDGIILKEYEWE